MNCQKCQAEIEESEFGATLNVAAQTHLRACATCRKFYDERTALRELVAGLGTVGAPPDFEFRLRARIAAEKSSTSPRTLWRRFAPGTISIALAACFALVVAATLRLRPSSPPTDAASVKSQPEKIAAANLIDEAATADAQAMKNAQKLSASVVPVEVKGSDKQAASNKLQNSKERRTRTTLRAANFVAKKRTDLRGSSELLAQMDGRALASSDSTVTEARNMKIVVPVSTSSESMRLVLQDERGERRVVSVEPVSFGAQQLVGRAGVPQRKILPTREGVW